MFPLSSYESLRDNKDSFFDFIESYVSVVIGKHKFRQNVRTKMISDFVTVSDEAFTLLILSNNEEVWPYLLKKKFKKKGVLIPSNHEDAGENNIDEDHGEDEELQVEITPKYTNRRKVMGHRREGWTEEGMAQFNRYHRMVSMNRRKHKKLKSMVEYEFQECQRKGSIKSHKNKLLVAMEGTVKTIKDWDSSASITSSDDDDRQDENTNVNNGGYEEGAREASTATRGLGIGIDNETSDSDSGDISDDNQHDKNNNDTTDYEDSESDKEEKQGDE
jgi:hypothetical protein